MSRTHLLIPFFLAAAEVMADPAPSTNATNRSVSSTAENQTGPLPNQWCQEATMTGDLGGLRTDLKDHGICVAPTWQAEVLGAVSGDHTGGISDGLFNIPLDLDLEKLTHLWKGATFHLNALEIYGRGLSERYVGDFSNTSNIAGPSGARLQEIWLQQSFFEQRFSIRAGMQALDSEFFASQAAGTFLNGTFGPPNLAALNFEDIPVYPVAAPGVRLDFAPLPAFDFKVGVFDPDRDATENPHGTDFDLDEHRGPLFVMEAAYLRNQQPGGRSLAGSYKVGGSIQQGENTSWTSEADNALDPSLPLHHGTNWAVYGLIDQEIWKENGQTVEFFARGGFASPIYSFITNYFDTGFNFIGFIPGRGSDVLGLGLARSGVGRRFSEAQERQGNPASTQETVIEFTYKASLTPWWSIQPDLQYILNPGGVIHTNNALVLGIRSTLTF